MIDLQFLFKTSHNLISIIVVLIISLYIISKSALNMIEKKRMNIFIPFFVLGMGLCFGVGFMLYNFYDTASDIYLITRFVSIIGLFFMLWRANK